MENFLKKKYVVPAIIIVIMLGAFAVRFYNFHDWLYFKMDQARDAFTISNAVLNGPGNLPLLGARAGATQVTYGFLNLGPIFYYFQYLSGVIFHSVSPEVFAYPDLFFGVMVLPLLYIFLRIYFKRYISLLVVLMYAFSFLIIEYSRFAWNPNSLPFFTILSFLALLKFFHPAEEKHKKWWLILWATGLAVGSQLHFVGFFSLVGVSGLMFLYNFKLWRKENIATVFKKEALKKISIFAGLVAVVFLLFYMPVIVSDSRKNWENSKNFIQALSSKPSSDSLSKKFTDNLSGQIRYYTLITTAFIYPKNINLADSLPMIFTVAIFIFGSYLSIKNIVNSNDEARKNFLMLILFWFLVFFILCIPLASSIRPRFFLFTFALPFIFLGFIFEFLEEKKIKYYKFAIVILSAIVLFSNINGTAAWFKEQKESQLKHFSANHTLILKNKDGVTLGQLERVANYIYENRKDDSRIYYYVKPEHQRPLEYLFARKNDPSLEYLQFKINEDPKAQYFAIVPADYKEEDIAGKTKDGLEVVSHQQFGQIAVWEITFSQRAVSGSFEFKKSSGGETNRIYWKNIFGVKSENNTISNELEMPQEIQDDGNFDSFDEEN